jgi:hypothetical protein
MKLESNKWYSVSEHKLLAEEIEGRIMLRELYDGSFQVAVIDGCEFRQTYQWLFVPEVVRYCFVDLPEEQLMELDGVKGTILYNTAKDEHEIYLEFGNMKIQSKRNYHTRSEAIHAANEFISRIKGG